MPSNKIGQLKPGQGLRRNAGQHEGHWRDQAAKNNYEIGDEMEADQSSPKIPDYARHKAGSSNH